MKAKAKVSFAGVVSMAAGETRDVPECAAAPLVACGYLEPVKEAPKKGARKKEAGEA